MLLTPSSWLKQRVGRGRLFLCLDPTYSTFRLSPAVTISYGPCRGAAWPSCLVYILCLFSLWGGVLFFTEQGIHLCLVDVETFTMCWT